jgi:hypothetical protein
MDYSLMLREKLKIGVVKANCPDYGASQFALAGRSCNQTAHNAASLGCTRQPLSQSAQFGKQTDSANRLTIAQ